MEYLTPPEIARLFGVSPDTVRRLIDNGELPSVRITDDGLGAGPALDVLQNYKVRTEHHWQYPTEKALTPF